MSTTKVSSRMQDQRQYTESQISNPDQHLCQLGFTQAKYEANTFQIPYCFKQIFRNGLEQILKRQEQNKKQNYRQHQMFLKNSNRIRKILLLNIRSTAKHLRQSQRQRMTESIAQIKLVKPYYSYDTIVQAQAMGEKCLDYLQKYSLSKVAIAILVQYIKGLQQFQLMDLYNLDASPKNFMILPQKDNKNLIFKHVYNPFILHLNSNSTKQKKYRNKAILSSKELRVLFKEKGEQFLSQMIQIKDDYEQFINDKKKVQQIHNLQLVKFIEQLSNTIGSKLPFHGEQLKSFYQLISSYTSQQSRQAFLNKLLTFDNMDLNHSDLKSNQSYSISQIQRKKQYKDISINKKIQIQPSIISINKKLQKQRSISNKIENKSSDFDIFKEFVLEAKQLKQVDRDDYNRQKLRDLYNYLIKFGFNSEKLTEKINDLEFKITKNTKIQLHDRIQQQFQRIKQSLKSNQQIKNLLQSQEISLIESESLLNIVSLIVSRPYKFVKAELEKLSWKQHFLDEVQIQNLFNKMKQICQSQTCQVFRVFLKQLIIDIFGKNAKKTIQKNQKPKKQAPKPNKIEQKQKKAESKSNNNTKALKPQTKQLPKQENKLKIPTTSISLSRNTIDGGIKDSFNVHNGDKITYQYCNYYQIPDQKDSQSEYQQDIEDEQLGSQSINEGQSQSLKDGQSQNGRNQQSLDNFGQPQQLDSHCGGNEDYS